MPICTATASWLGAVTTGLKTQAVIALELGGRALNGHNMDASNALDLPDLLQNLDADLDTLWT